MCAKPAKTAGTSADGEMVAHRAHELEERCPLPGVSRRTGDGGRIPASCPLFGPCGSVRMCVFDGALFPGPRLSPATAGMAGCSRPVSVSPPGWPACPPEGAPDVLGFAFASGLPRPEPGREEGRAHPAGPAVSRRRASLCRPPGLGHILQPFESRQNHTSPGKRAPCFRLSRDDSL